jgi:hypothetical protein
MMAVDLVVDKDFDKIVKQFKPERDRDFNFCTNNCSDLIIFLLKLCDFKIEDSTWNNLCCFCLFIPVPLKTPLSVYQLAKRLAKKKFHIRKKIATPKKKHTCSRTIPLKFIYYTIILKIAMSNMAIFKK